MSALESPGYFHFDPLMSALADWSAYSEDFSDWSGWNGDNLWREVADKMQENKGKGESKKQANASHEYLFYLKESWMNHLNKIKDRHKDSQKKWSDKEYDKKKEEKKRKSSENWKGGEEDRHWNKYGKH